MKYSQQSFKENQKNFSKMPTRAQMRLSLSQKHSNQKQKILREMAGDESEMEGMLNVKQKKLKDKTVIEGKTAYGIEVKEYVRNFDNNCGFVKRTSFASQPIDDAPLFNFAKMLKKRTSTRETIENIMEQTVNKQQKEF